MDKEYNKQYYAKNKLKANTSLGLMKEDVNIFENAIKYLNMFNK